MRVLVTHAGGAFGQVLTRALCAHAAVESITAVDARALRVKDPKVRTVTLDPREAAPAGLVADHDALVHLPPVPNDVEGAAQNVEAAVRPAHKLFQAAHAANVRRLVHVSSAAVYGAAIHAHEGSPLKPHAHFQYAREQAHLEQLLAIDLPHCVRLRPHLIVGPHADARVKRLLRQPFYPRLPEPQPLYQCVHEDDLAGAVLLALASDARGAFNIASEDSFSLRDAIRRRHLLALPLKPERARRLLDFAQRRLRSPLDPAWLPVAGETLLVNCRRAVTELGWRAAHSALDALATT